MIIPATAEPSEQKKALDKFVAMAHNNAHLMHFIKIAVDTCERKGTMKLRLDIKAGEAKGGGGDFSF